MKNSKGYYEKARQSLAKFLGQIQKNDTEAILDDLLTPQEITEIFERIEICRQLQQGKTQRDIATDMGISVTTVNRGSRILKYGTDCLKKYL